MKRVKKSKRAIQAKKYPKSELVGKPCFRKTIFPNEDEGEKGATIVWSRDPSAKRDDLHAYKCPDGCEGYHVGHRSYYKIALQKQEYIQSKIYTE
jgi:hypothetical protein